MLEFFELLGELCFLQCSHRGIYGRWRGRCCLHAAVYHPFGSDGKHWQAYRKYEQEHATGDQHAHVSYETSWIHLIALSTLTEIGTTRFDIPLVRLHVNREKLNT